MLFMRKYGVTFNPATYSFFGFLASHQGVTLSHIGDFLILITHLQYSYIILTYCELQSLIDSCEFSKKSPVREKLTRW